MIRYDPPRRARIAADESRQTHAKLAPKLGLYWGAYVEVLSQPTPDSFRVRTRKRRTFTVPAEIVEFLAAGEIPPPPRDMIRRVERNDLPRSGKLGDGAFYANQKRRAGVDSRPPIVRAAKSTRRPFQASDPTNETEE